MTNMPSMYSPCSRTAVSQMLKFASQTSLFVLFEFLSHTTNKIVKQLCVQRNFEDLSSFCNRTKCVVVVNMKFEFSRFPYKVLFKFLELVGKILLVV